MKMVVSKFHYGVSKIPVIGVSVNDGEMKITDVSNGKVPIELLDNILQFQQKGGTIIYEKETD